ncbi:MAG: glycerol-3-phosphate dehydrogenase [Proteobacteria bacterium]|nr:glycerol-3-phosphate dehydrogenase [Pseudomonadota bacterium]
MSIHDIAIIGGGINGAGLARDAAGRGLSVALYEKADLACATSSASTKLIHGGLRYLEHYAFALVRESLMERERLLKIAPHIIRPLRFVLPHAKGMRPAWMLRFGLFLYDHLGGRKILPGTGTLDLRDDEAGQPLKPGFGRAFEYSDLWCEDARLVVLNAMDASSRGAAIHTRNRVTGARRGTIDGTPCWYLDIRDERTGSARTETARILINAAGPWAGLVSENVMAQKTPARIRMVQGSHIVVRKLFDHDRAYIFQNADGRIIFAIPYEQHFTLIGTTDRDYTGDPADVRISEEETAYLCKAASGYFRQGIAPADVVWAYAGVRPLYDDGASKAQEATRDYVLHLDASPGEAPALSVFGGKLTTYRHLAENALEKLGAYLPEAARAQAGWTLNEALPGGDFPHDGIEALITEIAGTKPFLPTETVRRFARTYGTRSFAMLGDAATMADMGKAFGAGLTTREITYLKTEEWAGQPADLLWRRTKLGLHMSAAEREEVASAF